MSDGAYRLDALGWLQFQELCAAVIEEDTGVAEAAWHGLADLSRDALLPDGLPGRLKGPTLAAVLWLRRQIPPGRRRAAALGELDGVRDSFRRRAREDGNRPASILLMTNAEHEVGDEWVLAGMMSDLADEVVVIGTTEISQRLDASPALRRRFPAALGVTDLARLVGPGPREASAFDRRAAHELAPVFVATRPYRRAVASLEQHGFVVLTGPPEVGKTAIAQMLALVQMTDGWEAHDCRHPDELLGRYRADARQIFLADDAFGSTEYRPDTAERWARELDRVLARMDAGHWLVWTSRPAPLAAGLRRVHRERGLERFPDPGAVQVDASRLSDEERVLILFRHAQAAGLDDDRRRFVQGYGEAIVAHRYFTPERIRRLAGDIAAAEEPRARWLDEALRNPTAAMRNSLRALEDEHRDLLVALLDAPPSWISERELAHALRRHHPGGLSHAPHELIDRLAGHFLRVSEGSVGWVHPSWRDLVIDELSADAEGRARFLAAAGLDGLELAISAGGGAHGERNLPLVRGDADWDALTARCLALLPDLDAAGLARLLRALTVAVRAAPSAWSRREAAALARAALEATGDRLEPGGASLIEAWLEAADLVPDSPNPPPFTRLWARLLPTIPIDTPEKVARAEEWLALVDVLARYIPSDLAGFGYPDRYESLLYVLDERRGGAPAEEQALHTEIEATGPPALPIHAVSIASVLRDLG